MQFSWNEVYKPLAALNSYSTEGDHEYDYSDDYYATLRLGYYIIDFTQQTNGNVTWTEAQYWIQTCCQHHSMHFIVLFNEPKTEKRVDTRDYKMYGLAVGVGNPQSE